MVRGERLEVVGIRSCNHTPTQANRGGYDNRVHGRADTGPRPQASSQAGGAKIQAHSAHAADEESIDSRVAGVAAVDLGEHGQRYDALRPFALGPPSDCHRAEPKNPSGCRAGECVDCLGVEDQEACQKRSASATISSGTGPVSVSSWSSSWPNVSLSSSRRTAASM